MRGTRTPSREALHTVPGGSIRSCRHPIRVMLVVALTAWISLVPCPHAWADYWYEHYTRAESAMRNGNWDDAVLELLQALERKGDSGARVRSYGMNVIAYFPYLKLGIAYFHLGQHEAALQAFQTEEQLGEIQKSSKDMEELRSYRQAALDAREAASAAEGQRIAGIVEESLREAEILQRQGRLEAAMDALADGLAVDPTHQLANAKMEELRSEVVERDRLQRNRERATDLVSRGREALTAGDYSEASSLFRQALDLRPDSSTQDLLNQARSGLMAELQAQQDAEDLQELITSSLTQARQLLDSRDFAGALGRLQPILAAEPENRQALALQRQILLTQEEAATSDSIEETLAEAEGHFRAARYEAAISAANRALALDPGNTRALEQVRRSYGEISGRLLGSRTVENIPPAIRFADFRTDQPDGVRVQIVRNPDFRLNGVVIDNSPVDISFENSLGQEIEGRSSSQPVGDYHVTEFALGESLDAGPETYTLSATDTAGLSTSAEYAVLYLVPYYRTAWFRFVIAAIPIALLAGVWIQRARRRRRLLTRRFNPFIAGAPVLDLNMFFGRDRLVERILQTVHNNSLLLYGERRIGKTSLQHHIRKRLQQLEDPEFVFYPVYIDLQGTPESQFFATLAEDIFHELGPILDGMEASISIDNGAAYGYRELVHDLRRVIKRLEGASEKQVKLVLLIDEVDELNAYDPRINQRLRSLFMKSFAENLVAVVSGVEIRKQWDREGSPWYNFFEEIEVTPIQREYVAELITRPIEGVFKIQDGVIDRIIELSQCKPYRVQRICIALVNRAYEQGRSTISEADVAAVAGIEE